MNPDAAESTEAHGKLARSRRGRVHVAVGLDKDAGVGRLEFTGRGKPHPKLQNRCNGTRIANQLLVPTGEIKCLRNTVGTRAAA
jgi:hypothetical protein